MTATIESRIRSNELNMLLLDSKQSVKGPIDSRVTGLNLPSLRTPGRNQTGRMKARGNVEPVKMRRSRGGNAFPGD
jgi:hypothetical protein